MSPESVTFHNIYGRGKGGYDVAVRVVVDGGATEVVDDRIRVAGANRLLLLVRIVPWKTPLPAEASDAWAYSAENPDFTDRAGRFEAVPDLSESSVVAYQTAEDAVALLPQLVQSLKGLETDYDQLFVPHRRQHADLFDRVSIDLGGGDDRAKTSEELLATAVREKRLPAELAEKIYDGGRYMFICSAGELPPNLQGIWTGSWHPAWSGDFTLDTNLQLATGRYELKKATSFHLMVLVQNCSFIQRAICSLAAFISATFSSSGFSCSSNRPYRRARLRW